MARRATGSCAGDRATAGVEGARVSYEPKVGDYVILRGVVDDVTTSSAQVLLTNPWGRPDRVVVDQRVLMDARVTGPWAVDLAEAVEKVDLVTRALVDEFKETK